MLAEAVLADRHGNGEVVLKFTEGEPDQLIVLDNVYRGDRDRS